MKGLFSAGSCSRLVIKERLECKLEEWNCSIDDAFDLGRLFFNFWHSFVQCFVGTLCALKHYLYPGKSAY